MTDSIHPHSVVLHWDNQWQDQTGRQNHSKPETDVIQLLPALRERRVRHALDLGCGVGRHSLLLAQQGLNVTAIDLSPHGIEYTRQSSKQLKLDIDCHLTGMHHLPLADASVDYCLAWNVIYHDNIDGLLVTVREIFRVLRPNGLFHATLLSKRNINFGLGMEISPDTWVNLADAEKAHPHCYHDARGVCQLLSMNGMELWSLRDEEHTSPGSYHWHFLAEKTDKHPRG